MEILFNDVLRINLVVSYLISFPLRDCVAMERLRGEAVGFQRFRTRIFQVWGTVVGSKSNIFIQLATLNRDG
jgi:hypothetical protein